MATANPLPTAGEQPRGAVALAGPAGRAPGQALVPVPQPLVEDEEIAPETPVTRLPVELDVAVPVREFRVRNLLALEPGQLIESQWGNGEDMPLSSGDVQLAWSEFEVVDLQMAVRITRLV